MKPMVRDSAARLASRFRRSLMMLGLLTGMLVFPASHAIADADLLQAKCGACHAADEAGLSRISGQRKSPEGWLMTIVRMQMVHGVPVSSSERRQLVQWLADTQGLAPSETAGYRYAMEKDPDIVETVEAPLTEMCARCHTGARVALQRRTEKEWRLHIDFHVGQYPTIEYQALGRDRQWYQIAVNDVVPTLAKKYPFETQAWSAWSAAERKSPEGDWVVMVDIPGAGHAHGRLHVKGDGSPYQLSGSLTFPDGRQLPAIGKMNFYTGYEWRANVSVGGKVYRQILAVSEDGTRLSGRQFVRARDSLGGRLEGVRADAGPSLLGLVPEAVPAGGARVQAVGTGLEGLQVGASGAAIEHNDSGASVSLSQAGNRQIVFSTGDQKATLSVYQALDRIAVEPAYTISRVGGGSDVGPDVAPAQFKAIGYWNGPDGKADTDDDVRLGRVKADWSVAPHGDAAKAMQDDKFAGQMLPNGVFMPAVAGPNPKRPFSTNNAGELQVTAKVGELDAHARMVVTVQRFIDPPIR